MFVRVLTQVRTWLQGMWRAKNESRETHPMQTHRQAPHKDAVPQEKLHPLVQGRKACIRRQVRYRSDVTRAKDICENDAREEMDCQLP